MDNYMNMMNNFSQKATEIKGRIKKIKGRNNELEIRISQAKHDDVKCHVTEKNVREVYNVLFNYNNELKTAKKRAVRRFIKAMLSSIGLGIIVLYIPESSPILSSICSGLVGVIGGAGALTNYYLEKENFERIKKRYTADEAKEKLNEVLTEREEVKKQIELYENSLDINCQEIDSLKALLNQINIAIESLANSRKTVFNEIINEDIEDLLNEKFEKEDKSEYFALERKLKDDN